MQKFQKTSSILRVDFALSKRPHLHRAYLLASRLNCTPLYMVNVNTLQKLHLHLRLPKLDSYFASFSEHFRLGRITNNQPKKSEPDR